MISSDAPDNKIFFLEGYFWFAMSSSSKCCKQILDPYFKTKLSFLHIRFFHANLELGFAGNLTQVMPLIHGYLPSLFLFASSDVHSAASIKKKKKNP